MSSAASVAAYVPPARLSRFQRNLKQAVADGRLGCGIEAHHRVRSWVDPATNRRFTDVERRPLLELYDMMMPDQVAKCVCLKAACEAQWNRNFHGAYTTTAISPGSYVKGLDRANGTPKKVFSMPFSPSADVVKWLIAQFPEWYFVSLRAGTHDHPRSHVSNQVATDRLLGKLKRGTAAEPLFYVDLHGNPGANESFMRRTPGIIIISVVEAITPKDYVRLVVKWGSEFDANGIPRWYKYSIRDLALHRPEFMTRQVISGFISIQTVYYYDNAEIVRLLDAYKCPLHVAQHRFDGQAGSFNVGELTWVKRERSSQTIIYQTTSKTGAQYEHPDNSFWFEHDSLTCGEAGIAWDCNLLSEEIYYFIVVPCPRVQCEMSTRCLSHRGIVPGPTVEPNSTRTAQTQAQIAITNTVRLNLCGVEATVPIQPEHVAFFGDMRTAAIGKQRTASQLSDHITRCKIAAASKAKDGFKIDAQQLDDISQFSFMIDYVDQVSNDNAMFGNKFFNVITSDSLYAKTGTCVARRTAGILLKMVVAAVDASTPGRMVTSSLRVGIAEFNTRLK